MQNIKIVNCEKKNLNKSYKNDFLFFELFFSCIYQNICFVVCQVMQYSMVL